MAEPIPLLKGTAAGIVGDEFEWPGGPGILTHYSPEDCAPCAVFLEMATPRGTWVRVDSISGNAAKNFTLPKVKIRARTDTAPGEVCDVWAYAIPMANA